MSHKQFGGPGREKGQATVEFALIVGLLLLLLLGIIDFSRLVFNYATMSNGVREGARFAIVNAPGPGDSTEAHRTAIIERANEWIVVIGGTADVDADFPDDTETGGPFCSHLCRVVVVASAEFDAWTPVIPAFQMVVSSTMHYE